MTLTYNEYRYNCTDSDVSINAMPMCDIIQVGYRVETYTCQTFASSQINMGKAVSYSTLIYTSTGKTDSVTKKWAGCDLSHQVVQEGELGRNRGKQASVCTDAIGVALGGSGGAMPPPPHFLILPHPYFTFVQYWHLYFSLQVSFLWRLGHIMNLAHLSLFKL